MNISFEHYKVFYYVAEYRNITLAAEKLYSNQPNVTRTIKNLEKELGCTLFVRSNKGVTLTPEGEKLYRHVKIAVEQLITGEEELSGMQSLQSGIVTVAASEVALNCCLLPVLKEYHTLYPGIKLRITNNNTPEALNILRSMSADIAVVTLPDNKILSSDLESIPIREVNETAIISSDMYNFGNSSLSVSEIISYPLISLGHNTGTYQQYKEWFGELGLEFSPDVEAATAGQIIPMVKNGLGIGFVPEEFLKDVEGVCEIKLKEKLPLYRICLVKRKDRMLSPPASALGGMIRNS